MWKSTDIETLKEILAKQKNIETLVSPYKTTNINNRRYLGNKYKLLPFIKKVIKENCPDITSIADIFAGTGVVASAFVHKQLITNDIMYSNYMCHLACFGSERVDIEKIQK